MTPERWQQVSEALDKALRLPTTQRPAYFAQIARSDPDLHREVESLLTSHQEAGSEFLEVRVLRATSDEDEADRRLKLVGRRLGAYQIVEQIGVGGMGEVYRAVRSDDQYHKQVALKVVRGGQDSAFVISRFKNERQILASLDHPNIARLLDGGTTEDDAPYFVMELIEGESIDQYCEHRKLGLGDRLRLFLEVCSAVQFAHQRLIIHRDLKPGNILVTSDGATKLLDFGIAKILDPGAATETFEPTLTQFRALTPGYASPEQIKGEPITTASDVYSLGVILYELLTGHHPYRVTGDTPEKVAQAVCEVQPKKPSSVVSAGRSGRNDYLEPTAPSSVLTNREAEKLRKRLRGDLDNIVLMSLRKEQQRRYGSVELFAQDIRRHLENLPVSARNDTVVYRISKFARRHNAAIVATCIVIVALALGMAMTLQQKSRADRRFNDVRKLANSLLFEIHDSIRDLPGSTPARKLLVDRALQYLDSLSSESGNDLSLMRELATAYERVGEVQGHYMEDNLGDTKGSLDSYQKALEIRKQIAVKSHDWSERLALAQSYRLVANLLVVTGKKEEARDRIDRAIKIAETLNQAHPNDSQVLYELGLDYDASTGIVHLDDPDERTKPLDDARKALTAYEAALRLRPDDLRALDLYARDWGNIGQYLVATDPRAAFPYYQRELEIERGLTQRSNAVRYANRVAHAYGQIADAYESLGDNAREFQNATEALAIYKDLRSKDPENASVSQHIAIGYTNTALALARLGKFKASFDDWNKSVETMRKLVSSAPENQTQRHYLASVLGAGGTIFMRAHQPEAALSQFGEMRAIDQSLSEAGAAAPLDIANIAASSEKMGEATALAANPGKAAEYFHLALTVAEPLISARNQAPDYSHSRLNALYVAADAYSGLGDLSVRKARQPGQTTTQQIASWKEARSWYAKSLETWHRIAHPNHTTSANSFDVGDPVLVAKRLHLCDAALAHSKLTVRVVH